MTLEAVNQATTGRVFLRFGVKTTSYNRKQQYHIYIHIL